MIRELIDTELEAVAGGGLVDLNVVVPTTVQTNLAVQNAVAVGSGATAGNLIGTQTIFSGLGVKV